MTDQFYIDKRDVTAYDLLVKYGFDITLVSQTADVIDTNTGAITTPGTVTNTVTKGIMRFFSQDEVDDKNIKSGDAQVLLSAKDLAAADIVPDTDMRVIVGDDTYFVVRNTPTKPGGVAVLYRLQIRR